ncbi:3,4-dihydroxy 2-butanone 4-phosphate synthase/GTP cyclohydrolase II [Rhodococcus sp. 27YEA15]|uniref:3,4-dihydroxy-2-butanone-4-phosphate synthase n=1 Tax=Rhodococcus sp. 27YEA15 TaxID=3156259 RepID=UPI003C799D4C
MTNTAALDAISAIARGRTVVVLDEKDRENEADLVMAAQFVDTDAVAFFLEHTSGFLCTTITESRAAELRLPPMVLDNTESHGTAFLHSVDYTIGTSTGISASDRAATIRALSDPTVSGDDFARPGHVMPLQTRDGGVAVRPGHTEAGSDLCAAAGVREAALICELVTADKREMLRGDDAREFAANHGLPVITIAELDEHLRAGAQTVTATGSACIPTPTGNFTATAFLDYDGIEHVAMVCGDVAGADNVPVRVHSECLTGDLFGSLRCDCGPQLSYAVEEIAGRGLGAVVYLNGQEGRGIGLGQKLQAYALQQDRDLDTVDANLALGCPIDDRDYRTAARILDLLGIRSIHLMTNNPAKVDDMSALGVRITDRIPVQTFPTRYNIEYLRTKRDRMGHHLELPETV